MLEESRMDKKSLNRSLLQSKAIAIDSKKSTESANKPWPRNIKKREGSGNVPKNEPYRKNFPSQRGKGQMDKRPHPRSTTNFTVGGTQNTGIEEDEEPEIGSVFTPGSKKQNLNHLLNFMYPSRSGIERRGPAPRRQIQQWVSYRHEHDLYLRAYCQFVVKNDGDYKMNLMDPDLPIKWEQIEEIVVRSSGRSECPICLGTPVAGRVGHCGHVYCWACILHYAASHDKQPPPCPVCATSLQVSDMKPTRMIQWATQTNEVTMRLVRRLRGSSIVEVAPPRGQLKHTADNHILPLEDLKSAPYAKLFAATKRQVIDILERDRKQIEAQILEEIDTTEITYLEQALDMLKMKEEEIRIQYDSPKNNNNNNTNIVSGAPTIIENIKSNEAKLDWFDVTDEGAACIEAVENKLATLDLDSNLNPEAKEFECDSKDSLSEEFPLTDCKLENEEFTEDAILMDIDKQNQAKYFYFYQAEDGQQVFLNSLNIRMLNASWGSLTAAPSVISGRVLQRETLSLTEQTRKHMPYTAHLPLHCSFDIIELELKHPLVTYDAMRNFSAEIDRRARIRAKHERDERRRERAYRRAMEGPPRPDFSSELLFPPALPAYGSPPDMDVSMTDYEPLSPSTSNASPPQVQQASPSTTGTSTGLSFAKMASTSGTWRVRKVTAPPTPPPPPDDDSSAPRASLLSDAIEAALLASSPTNNPPSGKKSKKSKQKVLFTTGIHRAA